MSRENLDHAREPEDEWEREAVLDPMWEKQQKKTFTAWCNSHLRKVKTQIEKIEEDFRDGLKLMLLLEVISGEQLGKPDKGKMRFHKIANVNKALGFIEGKGVKLVSIGAEEIVDGNLKMTLGMIWTIILRFAIQDISVEEMTAKEGLLLWCKRKTAPYKNVNVQNFHMSFKDGLAFCALIHRHRPDLIDYNKLSRDNALSNLNLAFDVAEKHLDIPRMLDAEDMVQSVKPDERSVMAYVSSYYHAFSGAQQAEVASNRIVKVLKGNQENEKLMEEYEKLASDLLRWIERTQPWLMNRTADATTEATKRNMEKFRNYGKTEKPEKLDEKSRLDTTFNSLQTKLRLSNRPAYLPTQGKLISDINNAWKGLENAEKGYEQWLLSEIQRLERLDHLAKRFYSKCKLHDEWSEEVKDDIYRQDFTKFKLHEIKAESKKQDALESELSAHENRITEIKNLAQELANLGYHDMTAINARRDQVLNNWTNYNSLSAKRKQSINEIEKILVQIDQLFFEYAKQASVFNNWVSTTNDDLQDLFIVHSTSEIQALMKAHEEFKESVGGAQKSFMDLLAIDKNARGLINQHHVTSSDVNPYTRLTPQMMEAKWQTLRTLIPDRDAKLHSELTRQQANEQLRKQFALKANMVGAWIEARLAACAAVFSEKGSLEDHAAKLRKTQKEAHDFKPSLDELDAYNHAMHEAMVYDCPMTTYTMETLRVSWEQLRTTLSRNINELDNEMLTRDSKGISSQQMDDYRKSFQHFDRSKDRRLDPNEFKACLIAVGYKLDNKQGDADFQRIMAEVDPNRLGHVTFDAFLSFMTREQADAETADQLLHSFKILAGDKPYITAEQLRHELPAEHAEYCIGRMLEYRGPDSVPGALDYTSFATSLYGESDL